jgi:heavy metal sensor kinase
MGVMQSDHFTMALGISLEAFDADMARARNTFLISVAGAMLLIILGSSWLAGRALRPVTALTQTAEQVTAHGLDKRIDIGHTDAEFERLIGVFNAMLARLEESFSQAVRFSADASHELKTPLAVLQGELEAALQDSVSGSHAQAHYSRLLDEVQRLKSITRKLLLLSLADTGQLKVSRTDVDLSAIAEGAADDVEILAPKLRVDHQIEPGIHVMADPDLVRQVVHNLTSNAAKYTDESGRVRVKLRRNGTHVRFSVVNSGLGIPESERARIFDRFYRADKARGRDVEGSGLGLSLAREIARAHGGDLALDDTKPIITKFTLTLPIDG